MTNNFLQSNLSLDKQVFAILVLFFVYVLFEAYFRFSFIQSGTPFFVYSLKFIMVCTVVFNYRLFLIRKNLIFIASVLILGVNGFLVNNLNNVIIALVAFTPLIFFFFTDISSNIEKISSKALFFIFLVLLIGLIIDSFYEFPWEGFSGFVLDYELEATRLWWSDGVQRLAGFGRSSFETATFACFLALLIIVKTESNLIRLIVVILCTYAIYLTTTKGALVAFYVSILFFLSPRSHFFREFFFVAIVSIGNLVLLISLFEFKADFLSVYYVSLHERINFMWPSAMFLLSENGTIFGLGLGGIGVPLARNFIGLSAADNFWLYFYCLSGFLFGSVLLISTLLNSSILVRRKFCVLYVFFFTYGFTTNVIESALGQVIFAMFLNELFKINDKGHY